MSRSSVCQVLKNELLFPELPSELICENGGTPDADNNECICAEEFTGLNCESGKP